MTGLLLHEGVDSDGRVILFSPSGHNQLSITLCEGGLTLSFLSIFLLKGRSKAERAFSLGNCPILAYPPGGEIRVYKLFQCFIIFQSKGWWCLPLKRAFEPKRKSKNRVKKFGFMVIWHFQLFLFWELHYSLFSRSQLLGVPQSRLWAKAHVIRAFNRDAIAGHMLNSKADKF